MIYYTYAVNKVKEGGFELIQDFNGLITPDEEQNNLQSDVWSENEFLL